MRFSAKTSIQHYFNTDAETHNPEQPCPSMARNRDPQEPSNYLTRKLQALGREDFFRSAIMVRKQEREGLSKALAPPQTSGKAR